MHFIHDYIQYCMWYIRGIMQYTHYSELMLCSSFVTLCSSFMTLCSTLCGTFVALFSTFIIASWMYAVYPLLDGIKLMQYLHSLCGASIPLCITFMALCTPFIKASWLLNFQQPTRQWPNQPRGHSRAESRVLSKNSRRKAKRASNQNWG